MICGFCGAEIAENSKFCSSCGRQAIPPVHTQENSAPQPEPNGYYQQPSYSSPAYGNNQYGYQNTNGVPSGDYYNSAERVLISDSDTAKTLGIIGLICALFFRIAGVVLGVISISKANKCLRVRDDERFRSAKKCGVAAVVVNVVLMVFSVIIPVILIIINAGLIMEILRELDLDELFNSFRYYY